MLGKIAPKYFAGGESVLHNACLDISNWPPLQAGECIHLPMLGTLFQTSLTSANLQQPYTAPPTPTTPTSTSTVATPNQLEDLTNVSSANEPFTPSLSSDATKMMMMGSSNDTISERSEEYESNASVKNDNNISQDDNTRSQINASHGGGNDDNRDEIIQSREDILDSYKQSKEQLLAQKLNTQSDLPCDKNSSKSLTRANNNDNDVSDGGVGVGVIGGGGGDDNGDADFDDYLNGSYSDSCTNTQSETSTNIDRPLRIARPQSPAKTPIVLLSATEIDIFRSLYTVLSYTHLLWELVLTAEPIVVMATSPSDCSHMVQSLMRYTLNFGQASQITFK